jgi:4a-hydroxytetrahydrobiopterin dehydratase
MSLQGIVKRILLEKLLNETDQNKWKEINGKLVRTYKFPTYKDTIDFVNMVSDVAEKQQHHPEMIVGYDTVKVIIFDHEKGEETYESFIDKPTEPSPEQEGEELKKIKRLAECAFNSATQIEGQGGFEYWWSNEIIMNNWLQSQFASPEQGEQDELWRESFIIMGNRQLQKVINELKQKYTITKNR